MIKLAPSILGADIGNLESNIRMLHNSKADYIHIDIMDGSFVPAISFGTPIVAAARKYTDKTLDVHLMVNNPDNHIKSFADAGADIITVHAETAIHLHRTLQSIQGLGARAGVAINPATPLCMLEHVLEECSLVLIMTVSPGYGGQKYIDAVTEKIYELRNIVDKKGLKTEIEVDGGINAENSKTVINAGANVIVIGSAIFTGDATENINIFKKIFKEAER